jgi:hypothetical protein
MREPWSSSKTCEAEITSTLTVAQPGVCTGRRGRPKHEFIDEIYCMSMFEEF